MGDELVLEAAPPPPAAVIDLLSRHKSGIVACCGRGPDGWSAEDWQVFFDICPCLKWGKTPGVVQRPTRRRRKTRLIGATVTAVATGRSGSAQWSCRNHR